MNSSQMYALVLALAEAKNRQDVDAAVRFMHPDMELNTPAFGSLVTGLKQNEQALKFFFSMFPDYQVAIEGKADDGHVLVCWGTASMTLTGNTIGVVSNGQRCILPVFIQFTFKEDLIASERFFFDLSSLCAQSGISTDAVRNRLFGKSSGHP